MPYATASPNEYLVTGYHGKVINRGSGIQVFLWPGSTHVLIPSTKQEALFEMTQETKDGIPLRFKGIVIYRIVEPVTTSMSFNFSEGNGLQEINALITNICLGELRAVVSGMTMQECIEKRKTVLTAAVDSALRVVVTDREGTTSSKWGIDLELVQVAQVFIVDAVLRKQLEAEVRNEIRAKSEQSDIHTQEEIGLAQIASDRQIREQKVIVEKDTIKQKELIGLAQIASDRQIQEQRVIIEKDAIKQKELIGLAQIASDRQLQEQKLVVQKDAIRQKEEIEKANLEVLSRSQKLSQELEKEGILLSVEKYRLEQEAAKEKEELENPIRLMQVENQHEFLSRELSNRQIELQIREHGAKGDMLLEQARQELRKEILPIEQIPEIAESLSKVFKDTRLSVVGSENPLLSSIYPLLQMISDMVKYGIPGNPQAPAPKK